MSDATYQQLLDLMAGGALVAAVVALWRRSLSAIVRTLAFQGLAVAAVALLLGIKHHEPAQLAVAIITLIVKVGFVPAILLRIVTSLPDRQETERLVNPTATLVVAAVTIVAAFGATQPLVRLTPSPESNLLPTGFAVVLVAYLGLVTRRNAVTQIVGFLTLENGVALVAVLAAAHVSLASELAVSLDVLLAVLVLQVLTTRMRSKVGAFDLDHLQELRD